MIDHNNKKIILTGTPGSGKTSIINLLREKGYDVIQEASTFIIKKEQKLGTQEPWKNSDFIDKIISLQKRRERKANTLLNHVQFFDRSPLCTYALATYLRFSPSTLLCNEIICLSIYIAIIYSKRIIRLIKKASF
ncbi:hypothetical protein DID78_05475 [Candidatus Marinamargulisbacteria bacterium SCGC AG-343-D04]|nr:hypothetical protein DID78_05475 [Candidatus Marinamargulisbacteria bacterium SCGC AG-343-D04]